MNHKPRPLSLSDKERALFAQAVAGARPLAATRIHHEPPRPAAVPRQRLREEAGALDESLHPALLDLQLEGGDEPSFQRPGLAHGVLRDLRRGRWAVEDHLDLHGATRDEARQLLADFLALALRRRLRCLRVVHGKGLGSPGREPVLKGLVKGWLMQHKAVLAFCQARAAEGGSGALLLLLRTQRRPAA